MPTFSKQQILELFRNCDSVGLFPKKLNYLKWRIVRIGHQELPFLWFLEAIGINPEQLRPLLNLRKKELPAELTSFDQLKDLSFGSTQEEFRELARILKKTIVILVESDHIPPPSLKVHPDGRIELPPDNKMPPWIYGL